MIYAHSYSLRFDTYLEFEKSRNLLVVSESRKCFHAEMASQVEDSENQVIKFCVTTNSVIQCWYSIQLRFGFKTSNMTRF